MPALRRLSGAALLPVVLVLVQPPADAATPPPPPRPDEVLYPIQRGDTLYHLSTRYLTTPAAARELRRINHVGNVRRLPAGGYLHIPRALLRDEPSPARVESFSGEVTLRLDRAPPAPARAGAALVEGTVIETGRRGFLSLRLADDSTVTIPSQSTVQVVRLRRILLNNAVEREFRTLGGRVRAKVSPMDNPASTFRVGTPITVSAVRGTEFRVTFDPAARRALTEVEDGKVKFGMAAGSAEGPAAPIDSALLTPGFGAVASPAGVGPVTALLPPPKLVAPDRAQTEPELRFVVEPDPAAAGYRIQIGRDAGLLDVIDEASGADPHFVFGTIPTGTYFVRVAALDAQGAEGLGRTYAFDRVLNAVSGALSAEGRRYRFKWSSVSDGTPQFRFRLLRKPAPGSPAAPAPVVDEPLGRTSELAVTDLRAGEYSWQVLSIVPFGDKLISTWSAPQQFEVTARR